MNTSTFTGRFAAAPRRKDTANNNSRCYFTLMVSNDRKKPDGTKYPAQAVDFVAWGKTAETICQYKDKGHLVLVTAEYSTYPTDPVDVNNQVISNARKVNRPIFTVRNIEFMPVPGGNSNNNNNGNNNNYNNSNSNQKAQELNPFEGFDAMDNENIPTFNDEISVDFNSPNGGNNGGNEDPFNLGNL